MRNNMKTKIIITLLVICGVALAGDCPLPGDAKNETASQLNILKNRDIEHLPPASNDISLALMLAPGDDTARFDSGKVETITGYVMRVIPGGIESCNCHAKDLPHRDTHIYIALDAQHAKPSQCVIAEVTPRGRATAAARGEDWSTATLKATLTGRMVTFTGYMLFDSEHKQNAVNTNPGNKRDWRATVWEIHPISGISVQ